MKSWDSSVNATRDQSDLGGWLFPLAQRSEGLIRKTQRHPQTRAGHRRFFAFTGSEDEVAIRPMHSVMPGDHSPWSDSTRATDFLNRRICTGKSWQRIVPEHEFQGSNSK